MNAHSAKVRLRFVADRVYSLRQVGTDMLIAGEDIPPCSGVIEVEVDGRVSRDAVTLENGAVAGEITRLAEVTPAPEGEK